MEVTTAAPLHQEPVEPAAACVWWDGNTVNVYNYRGSSLADSIQFLQQS